MPKNLALIATIITAGALGLACEEETTALTSSKKDNITTDTGDTEEKNSDEEDSQSSDPGTTPEEIPTDDEDTSKNDDICAEQDFTIEYVPTRLMILQDVSGSMQEVPSGTTTNKWEQAKGALLNLLAQWKGREEIEFGFDLFPDDGYCGVDEPVVQDAGQGNIMAIETFIEQYEMKDGTTPLCKAMNRFDREDYPNYAPVFTDAKAASYLLVVSDGEDTCGGFGVCGGLFGPNFKKLTEKLVNSGIKVIVIGFGTGSGSTQLNSIAANGGTGYKKYINADDQTQLQNALESIASEVVGCVYDIEQPPEGKVDPEEVNFYFTKDGAQDEVIYKVDDCSSGQGWHWTDDTQTKVEFCAQTCERLKAGDVNGVKATFGCPTVIPR